MFHAKTGQLEPRGLSAVEGLVEGDPDSNAVVEIAAHVGIQRHQTAVLPDVAAGSVNSQSRLTMTLPGGVKEWSVKLVD